MTTTTVHSCPRCDLRFRLVASLEDHLRTDHHVELRGAPEDELDLTEEVRTWGQVTVPTSPSAMPAHDVAVAARIARQAGMALEVVAVHERGLPDRSTGALLRRRAGDAAAAGAPTASWALLDTGDVAGAIVDHVRAGETTLLCMATRARRAATEMVLGSVSEQVVRDSPVPVVLVGPRCQEPPESFRTIVVATDGSRAGDRAVTAAAALAARMDLDLHLVQVLEADLPPLPDDVSELTYLNRVRNRLPASRTTVDAERDDDIARAIIRMGTARRDPLLVVGTHGRSGWRRLALGSVAMDVVRRSPVPVVVVGRPADEEDDEDIV